MALTTTITVAGNLTADPELKQDRNNKPYARVSIAVNPREYDRETKEWKDGEPVFWNGTVFGDLAEHVAHSLSRGQRVIASGTVKTNAWTDRDSGTKKTSTVLQIEDIGPSLLYLNAVPSKSAGRTQQPAAPDEWAGSGSVSDDTPF